MRQNLVTIGKRKANDNNEGSMMANGSDGSMRGRGHRASCQIKPKFCLTELPAEEAKYIHAVTMINCA